MVNNDTKIKNLVQQLRKVVLEQESKVYALIKKLASELTKKNKKTPTINDLYEEVKEFMSFQQVYYYYNIRFATKKILKHVSERGFARLMYANSGFHRKEIQDKFIELRESGKWKWSEFAKTKTPSNYVKELIPELRTEFDSKIPIIQTMYHIRGLRGHIKKYYDKLTDFQLLCLQLEFNSFKEEFENLFKKKKWKKIWTIKLNSKAGFHRAKKYFKNADVTPHKFELKVHKDDLIKNIDNLRRFHYKIE